MPCDCGVTHERRYAINPTLWSHMTEGMPSGPGLHLKPNEIVVCTNCGQATFKLLAEDLSLLRARS
jgi:hypothetical protein